MVQNGAKIFVTKKWKNKWPVRKKNELPYNRKKGGKIFTSSKVDPLWINLAILKF